MRPNAILAACLVTVSSATFPLDVQAIGASLPCGGPGNADEKAVCGSCALQQLDVKMATLYDVARHLVPMGTRGALQDEQGAWQAQRQSCGEDAACIARAYEDRIDALNKVLAGIYSRGPY